MVKKIKVSNQTDDAVINLALDTIMNQKQSLIFVNTKRSAEKCAEEIAKKIKKGNEELNKISEDLLKVLSKPTKQCERLAKCVKKGIAFHHAGLTHKQKELIEDSFRSRVIKIICNTPTLALGVDLPAFRAVIRDLKRYGYRGYTWIPVLEYLQQAGRAGRPSFDTYGEAIAIAVTKPEKDEIFEKYVKGKPEDIYSKLAVEPVLRTYLLSLIAANFTNTKREIIEFFEKTFYAYQFKDTARLESIISRILKLLEEWEFIRSTGEDFKSADELEDEKYKATILGKRIAELYIDPLTAYFIICCSREASDRKLVPFSFLQMVSHTAEIKPLLKVRTKEYDKIQDELTKYFDYLLEKEPPIWELEYEDFINSVKTALIFVEWTDEKDEEFLLKEYNIRPGELRIKLEVANWLLYASMELCKILQFKYLTREISKLRIRLKHGVKEELIPLLKLEQIGRVRARKLYRNKIRDIRDVKNADLGKLIHILGEKIALAVKKQVGQEIKEIPERKRKGQISLKDY